ncbi:MAG: hypothetical protein BZ137_00770 [Methanosphaera sp. rholeuAM130]|nr:MAG: hypothetical protein BZ137_00770 [Methanosphaera sp. rholeuAM130]
MNISTITPSENRIEYSFIIPSEKDFDAYMKVISAFDNYTRMKIVEVLIERLRKESKQYHSQYIYPLNSKEIKDALENDKKIKKMTEQGWRNHLTQLREAGIIGRIKRKVDQKGNPINNTRDSFFINMNIFDRFLFGTKLGQEQIRSYMLLSNKIEELKEDYDCVMMVCTGSDKSKCLTFNKEDEVVVGRESSHKPGKYDSKALVLSSIYKTVTEVEKPHLKVFYKDGEWFIVDYSSNGTFISNKKLKKGVSKKVKNNSFIQLSEGDSSVVLYFSYT